MYKQIICPVDGSATSNNGMHEAIKLAKDHNAKLRFLHIIDTYFPILDVTGDLNVIYIDEILRKNGKKVLKKAPNRSMKIKALRTAIEDQLGIEKTMRKKLKALLSQEIQVDTEKIVVDGKVVTLK